MKRVYYIQSIGSISGNMEFEINLSLNRELTKTDEQNINKIGDLLREALYTESIKNNLEIKLNAKVETEKLIALFPNKIFIQEIPNEYSNDAYYQMFPWLLITTNKGPIKIGWRKRVIEIDWSNTIIDKLADDLFPDEDVTKSNSYIHAWSYEKAQEYINKLLQ